jgi:hypothetical protein
MLIAIWCLSAEEGEDEVNQGAILRAFDGSEDFLFSGGSNLRGRPRMKYRKLSFPLAGNLSFTLAKKDAGQVYPPPAAPKATRAGMTGLGSILLYCRVNK